MEETLKQRPGLMIAAPYKLKGKSLKIQIADYLKLKGFETSYHGVSVYFENELGFSKETSYSCYLFCC